MEPVIFTTDHPYSVFIGPGEINRLAELVSSGMRIGLVYDEKLASQAKTIASSLCDKEVLLLEVPSGEPAKNIEVVRKCWNKLAENHFTRTDLIIGFGGGATTDLAGFVAATWLRGVGLINIPTSVLAMTDASIGGKTGINIDQGKNLVGAFHEPKAVICDTNFLATLPQEEIVSGLGEIIKCGFIKDHQILTSVLNQPKECVDRKSKVLVDLIRRGAQVKADTVAADLYENTSIGNKVGRESLNYGHTLAHAIEAVDHFKWRHGQADAIGMVFAAELAHLLGYINKDLVDFHRKIFTSVGLPIHYRADWSQLREKMRLDKKTRGDKLRFIVLDQTPGKVRVVAGPPEDALQEAFLKLAGE